MNAREGRCARDPFRPACSGDPQGGLGRMQWAVRRGALWRWAYWRSRLPWSIRRRITNALAALLGGSGSRERSLSIAARIGDSRLWRSGLLRARGNTIHLGCQRMSAEFLELRVEVSQRGVLAGLGGRTSEAARREVTAAEKIGRRDHGSAHRTILIGALRPGKVAFQPKKKAHEDYFRTVRDSTASSSPSLENGLHNERADGKREMSDESGMAAR